MSPGGLRGVKNLHGADAGGYDFAIGKADPPALVLAEQLVAHSPILRLIFSPVGMDLPGDLRG